MTRWVEDVLVVNVGGDRLEVAAGAGGRVVFRTSAELLLGLPWAVAVGLTPQDAAAVADVLDRFARTGVVRPPTRVASVRGKTADAVAAAGVVYVGRDVRTPRALEPGVKRFSAHPLANPYRLPRGAGREVRAACVSQYREWLLASPERVAAARRLAGKTLGCWCGDWDGVGRPTFDCHAVVLADVAEGRL